MHLSREPKAPLIAFVSRIWVADVGAPVRPVSTRELLLPAAQLHLVIRLEGQPLRVYCGLQDSQGRAVSTAVIAGLRMTPYLKEASRPVPSVGALLRPGLSGFLAGVPAAELTGAHTPLEDLWSHAEVERIRARLAQAKSAQERLDLFEAILTARLPAVASLDPRIAQALMGFASQQPVGQVVREAGTSHRHFASIFREAVGLRPKTYCRLLRFNRSLAHLGAVADTAWADLAAAEGYADQAHFTREFRDFTGLSPGQYRRLSPRFSRHVPL